MVKGLKTEDELETTNSDRAETNRRQPIHFECSIRRCLINWRLSGRKGSGRGAKNATTRELGKAAQADKPIERVEERERDVNPREAGAKIRKSRRNLKLSLRGSVETPAQHWVCKPVRRLGA